MSASQRVFPLAMFRASWLSELSAQNAKLNAREAGPKLGVPNSQLGIKYELAPRYRTILRFIDSSRARITIRFGAYQA
jgi:hypothetical protein